ncbi:peptidase M3A/M3B [Bisporella sp. PMI_857]|nr:peptidase M3A/M3B [Bisporella sp. PMI_857]
MREDIFQLVQKVLENTDGLDSEDQMWLEKRRDGIQKGLQILPGESRQRFKHISQRLLQLRSSFMQNLTENQESLLILSSEVHGVPGWYIRGLESKAKGHLLLPLKKPDITMILNTCQVPATRRKVFEAFENQHATNNTIFKETILLRDESARLLGYPNYAALRLESLMAKSPENVQKFLKELATRLMPKAKQELEVLLTMKRNDTNAEVDGSEPDRLFHWDFPFYNEQLLKQKYIVDSEEVSEYFPTQIVVRAMLDVFQVIFGLTIEEFTDSERKLLVKAGEGSDCVWHPDVRVFGVWSGRRSMGLFLGYLYVDLYPREGKYTHNANFSILPGCVNEDGIDQFIATALVCNITKPTLDSPSLLKHSEVITVFHELGHSMHCLLSKTKYACFHGTNTASDFIEAPSQLLEFWCWQPRILQEISYHVSYLSPSHLGNWQLRHPSPGARQPPKQIPLETVQHLCSAKEVNQALLTLHQVGPSVFDMTIHSPPTREEALKLQISSIYNGTRRDFGLLEGPEVLGKGLTWGHGYTKTQHFMWGQDANYYSYLYSKVFATDIFHYAFYNDPLSAEAGKHYRHSILEKGGSQEAMEILTRYLGRLPNAVAFEQELGI